MCAFNFVDEKTSVFMKLSCSDFIYWLFMYLMDPI